MLTLEDVDNILKEIKSKQAVVLDVRNKSSWDIGHIKGAVHFSKNSLEKGNLPNVSKNMKIYTYCGGGTSGPRTAEMLKQVGFQNVSCIREGYRGWKKSGGSVVE